MSSLWETVSPPTAAGGTGGSGTRVITEVLSASGVFMGSHLNLAGDSLDLADFEWRWGEPYLAAEQAGQAPHLEGMERAFYSSVGAHLSGYDPATGPWGWKHPHSYLLLPWLDALIPQLRFIHIVRDGRRMAFSRNQKQPLQYGEAALGAQSALMAGPARAIRFWSWANERAADYGEGHMQGRYLRLRFEDICEDPRSACATMIAFAHEGKGAPAELIARTAALVSGQRAQRAQPTQESAEIEQLGLRGLERFGYL
ncbi:MAG: sulfotransferase [Solirubrobacteraceae bacterium]